MKVDTLPQNIQSFFICCYVTVLFFLVIFFLNARVQIWELKSYATYELRFMTRVISKVDYMH